jgi:hypothetical protein
MLVREHALLAKAVEAEVTDFLGKHADLKQFGAQMIRHRRAEPDLARRHHLCRDRSGLALRSWTSTAAIVGWATIARRTLPTPTVSVLALDPAALYAPL